MAGSRMTPMLRQYRDLKQRHPDALLFYRLGDFYELFEEDARVAARELGLVLTSRRFSKKVRLPMCGVPYRNATGYVARLLRAGHKVAIAEQLEDARRTKGLVKRDVVRIITPGTVVEEELLPEKGQSLLAALVTATTAEPASASKNIASDPALAGRPAAGTATDAHIEEPPSASKNIASEPALAGRPAAGTNTDVHIEGPPSASKNIASDPALAGRPAAGTATDAHIEEPPSASKNIASDPALADRPAAGTATDVDIDVSISTSKSISFGLAIVDLSTGEFAATQGSGWATLADELQRLRPREMVLPQRLAGDEAWTRWLCAEAGGGPEAIRLSPVPDLEADAQSARQRLDDHFAAGWWEEAGLASRPLALAAAGAALYYLQENQISDLAHLRSLSAYDLAEYVGLDATTRRNLELTATLREGRTEGSLLEVLD
ncbi:MAG: hypothetical protein PVG11_04925, partial [Anaerolineae bacterium]